MAGAVGSYPREERLVVLVSDLPSYGQRRRLAKSLGQQRFKVTDMGVEEGCADSDRLYFAREVADAADLTEKDTAILLGDGLNAELMSMIAGRMPHVRPVTAYSPRHVAMGRVAYGANLVILCTPDADEHLLNVALGILDPGTQLREDEIEALTNSMEPYLAALRKD